MEFKDITEKIIKCAYNVYNKMGYGFLESVYENCMKIELGEIGLNYESQKPVKVYYYNKLVGKYISDIIVNDNIILELKSIRKISKTHEVQLVNYLTATNIGVGLLINFGEQKVEVKRKIRNLNIDTKSIR